MRLFGHTPALLTYQLHDRCQALIPKTRVVQSSSTPQPPLSGPMLSVMLRVPRGESDLAVLSLHWAIRRRGASG